jgi:hypothetical protein
MQGRLNQLGTSTVDSLRLAGIRLSLIQAFVKVNRIMTKRPKRVQAPEGCADYLTAGKIYDVVGFFGNLWSESLGYGFKIKDDSDKILRCNEKQSVHLNDQDWIIVETETED